jgi:hypothetical protein
MAFDANRDIKIEASQGESGNFLLRTKGLADRRRPELEIIAVPEPALRAAANVLNDVADYTVNRAEVLADQNVGFQMQAPDDERQLMLVVHTLSVVSPSGGLWSKLTGGGKGVLRLVDALGERSSAPRTAIATMQVHRARVRLSKDDRDGARTELEAAIESFPGAPHAGRAPKIGDSADADYNWQNHLAYLALAELDDDPVRYADALARSDELSDREIGASLEELAKVRDAELLERQAAEILRANADPRRKPGPHAGLAIVASPIWERRPDGTIARRASLVPAKFVELYFEGPAAERLRASGAKLAARALATHEPATLAWRTRDTRNVWSTIEAPLSFDVAKHEPAQGLLSSVLADLARSFRAGATDEEASARLAGEPPESLDEKLAAHETWESEQYTSAMTGEA